MPVIESNVVIPSDRVECTNTLDTFNYVKAKQEAYRNGGRLTSDTLTDDNFIITAAFINQVFECIEYYEDEVYRSATNWLSYEEMSDRAQTNDYAFV